jgi:tetratricopeptide (TPR) repeat protein
LPSGARVGNEQRIQGITAAVQGRLDGAIAHFRALQQAQLKSHQTEAAAETGIAIGGLYLVKGQWQTAIQEVDKFFARYPLDSMDVLDRPYMALARFYADAGHPARALTVLGTYERQMPQEFRSVDAWAFARARAAVRLAEGNPRGALEELDRISGEPPDASPRLDDNFLPFPARPELARALDRAGRSDSAIATYERYLAALSADRVLVDMFELPNALLRLAELHEARGERAVAARNYLRFAKLWKNADPDLQPRVENARARAARLLASEPQKR